MNPFYKMIRNLIAEENTSSHFSFKIVDPTAIGNNPVRELSLDVVSIDETSSIISLAWKDSAEKILEKTTSTQEANHLAELISTDLAQVVKLTSEDNYAEAKKVMENVLKTYLETTDTPVSTNMPKLHNTQASVGKQADPEIAFERAIDRLDSKLMKGLIHQEEYDAEYAKLKKEMFPKEASLDDKLWRQAKISLTNTFPSGTKQEITFESAEELNAYEGKKNGKTDQDHIPLWDAQKGKGPAKGDGLSPASLSYEDVENEKERDHEDMQKHIDETIKNKLESAMQEKAASVFGPADIELVKSLRAPGIGRNWDEIKKIFIKDLNRDKDATTIFLDEQRESLDPTGIEVEPVKEEPESLRPPKELVPDSVHDKLLQDHEDKKKDESPLTKDKELNFTPKDVMNIPEDEEIEKVESSLGDNECIECGTPTSKDETYCPACIAELESLHSEIARADNDEIHKVAQKEKCKCGHRKNQHDIGYSEECDGSTTCKCKNFKEASIKKAAPSDLNPLQEPLTEKPTTPSQDVVPFGQSSDHRAPKPESWVIVKTDLKGELPSFRGKFISEKTESDGSKWGIVDRDGELLQVEMNRITPESEGSGAQETEPVMEPQIEQQQPNEDVQVTPKMDDLHTSSQDPLLAIKIEAEALLKDIEGMGKTSYIFVKKGLEKHAGDSAFEANGWTRVWVDESEIEVEPEYAEILKMPDENARIQALKELARKVAQDTLSTKANAGGDIAQMWFDSLKPSDHDRIDWVALATPQVEAESSLKQAEKVCPKCREKLSLVSRTDKEGHTYSNWECIECNNKQASDFEKGISQNKTSAETLPATTPDKNKKQTLKDPNIDPYKHHWDLVWEEGDPCKLCKSPIDENCQCTNPKCEFHNIGQAFCATKPEGSEPDQVDLIMAYEQGDLDDAGVLKLFSMLIKSGQAWSLQGSYGRTAKALIDAGYINEKGTITKDVVDTEVVPEQKMLSKQYAFKNEKTAADPVEAPKTQFKDYKITPKYTPKEQAVPATPEMDEVLTKMNSLQSNLATLEAARKQIQAKMKEELEKIDQQGGRAEMEAALQETIEKTAVILSAMDNKVVQWKDKLFTLQTEQIDEVPSLTPKEMLAKIYAKFEGAEKYVQDVLNGMLSQAKRVVEKTLIRWPNKNSSLNKEATIIDDINHYNEELLAALKELSSPL